MLATTGNLVKHYQTFDKLAAQRQSAIKLQDCIINAHVHDRRGATLTNKVAHDQHERHQKHGACRRGLVGGDHFPQRHVAQRVVEAEVEEGGEVELDGHVVQAPARHGVGGAQHAVEVVRIPA